MIRVALDAMGGDEAPAAEVDGAALALRELAPGFQLLLVGQPEVITERLDRHPGLDRSRIEIVPASQVITMEDKPLQAVRQKRDSSLVVGLGLHRDGKADAFVSAGNTGAMLAGATLLLGLHDGVERATVASLFPAAEGPVLVLDAGANVDCSARELVNFAHLGTRLHARRDRPTCAAGRAAQRRRGGREGERHGPRGPPASPRRAAPQLCRQHRGARHRGSPPDARPDRRGGHRRIRRATSCSSSTNRWETWCACCSSATVRGC